MVRSTVQHIPSGPPAVDICKRRFLIRAKRTVGWTVVVVLALFPVACGRPAGVVFEPLSPPLGWPHPPDAGRVWYVGQLVTDQDLKPARSFGQRLHRALFGARPARSMLSPYSLCTDGRSRLFVCDANAQLVHVFDLDTRAYEQWRPDESGPAFAQPVGITTDSLGRVLVCDSVLGAIVAFDADGQFLGLLGEDALARPTGLAFDPRSQRIFVADAGTHQIIVLDIEGHLVDVIGRRGTGPGQFNYPTNVAFDSTGNLYVSDSLNFRVQVFDRDLKPIRQIGSKGDRPGWFSLAKGIALDSQDHLYVVDAQFEAVQVFAPSGELLMTFGDEGQGPGQFWLPAGIHIDSHDRIWIADSYNRRVQVFEFRAEVE